MNRLIICNGNVEVTTIDPVSKKVNFMLYFQCPDTDVNDPEVKETMTCMIMSSCRYLYLEGFLPLDLTGWQTNAGVSIQNEI
jgi:hypothetical protein